MSHIISKTLKFVDNMRHFYLLLSSNWSGHHPFTVEITGSSPVGSTYRPVGFFGEELVCHISKIEGSNPSETAHCVLMEVGSPNSFISCGHRFKSDTRNKSNKGH